MKMKEFIAKVEALGFLVYDGHCYLEVKDTEGKDVVDILKAKRWVYDCEFDAFESLHEVKQTELMEFVTEYVTTQVKDREEEKRYRLWLSAYGASDFDLYRTKGHGLGGTNLNVLKSVTDPLLIFTESEIAELDIDGFEKVEVNE